MTIRNSTLVLLLALLLAGATACVTEPATNNSNNSNASPSPSPSASNTQRSAADVPVTLPVLDALLSDDAFRAKVKSQVQLSDSEIQQLQKIASDEVAKLREANAEDQSGSAEESRQRAAEAIRGAVGEEKAQQLFTLAREYWVRGNEEAPTDKSADNPTTGPNAVPKDTRVVVNIPAYRMDVFREGELVKSYKIGIGYPEFPLPTGTRKAQTIIFNPTWTPPDEPWVAKMKGISAGEKIEAGSKLNPLGPIKIPIGLPSLIHGGKSPAKLGTFASHGCVGLTTAQVQDFARLLAQASGTEMTDSSMQANLKDKTQTKVVKLSHVVPVELRYETIVAEDGKLHIYKDVYDQDSNTEENLRAVLEANGVKMEDLTESERTQVLDALNAMSRHPEAVKSSAPATTASPTTKATNKADREVAKTKSAAKNQKEIVIEIAALKGKGYPVAVNLDTGTGKPPALMAKKA